MTCTIVDQAGGLITLKISGKLKRAEVEQAEKVAIEAMRSGDKVRFLLLGEDFQGWDRTGDWGDLSFQGRYDDQIERIAIIGEKHWQELVEVFLGKGRRSVDIRYFTPSQGAIARAWITQTARANKT